MSTKELGAKGEEMAEKFLKKQGYKIIGRNFQCKFGEIDLIGYHKNIVSFIEVKTRTSDEFGEPLEAVDKKKQRKLTKTANYFIFRQKIPSTMPCQFDVISITMDKDNKANITLIQNAFMPIK